MPKFTIEQEQAITKTGTNIIVSAGAGSGKTAVLTERVVRKLQSGIDINRILVLTFTKEAANEMKDRIRQKIKSAGLTKQLDYIESAYITTFDSYALSIVKKYNYLLNVSKNISIIDSSILSIEKNKFIEQIFESMYGEEKFDNFISNFSVKDDKEIKSLILKLSDRLDLLSDKKDFLDNYIDRFYSNENINYLLTQYDLLIKSYVKDIRNTVYELVDMTEQKYGEDLIATFMPLMNSTDYKSIFNNVRVTIPRLPSHSEDDVKDEKERLKKQQTRLIELLKYDELNKFKDDLFKVKDYLTTIIDIIKKFDIKVNEYKEKNDLYDFIDIAKLAIKVLKENEDVKEELKNYYHEIMIDEYQDTNDLQEEFIKLIENNNVYCVGDIKQSIYRFRNANPNIFRNKYSDYSSNKGGIKIDLLKNFRSREEVIDDINKIFNRIMDIDLGDADYEKSHQMIFGNNAYKDKCDNKINNNLEILNYNLENSNYSCDEVEAFAIARDIIDKIATKYQIMDKDTTELRSVKYSDFCIILDRYASFELYKKIFEYFKIPLTLYKDEILSESTDLLILKNIISAIIKIHDNVFDKEFTYYLTSIMRSFLIEADDNTIFNYFKNKDFKNNSVYDKLKYLSTLIDDYSIYDITNKIFEEFNIYEKSITRDNISSAFVGYEYMLNLASSLTESGYTILEYSNYLNDLINNKIEIRYPINKRGTNAVKIMNIHKSKGLEFPICYFAGYQKTFNKKDLNNKITFDNDFGIILPLSLENKETIFTKELLINKYNREEISEKIRLFYVALTRTREKMIIVTSLKEDTKNSEYLVDYSKRIEYNSFLDIISSIKNTLKPNIKELSLDELSLTKEYDKLNASNYEDKIPKTEIKINTIENNITYQEIDEKRYSKENHNLLTIEDRKVLDMGLDAHYKLEIEDFKNPKSPIVKDLVSKLDLKPDTICYKELEFTFMDDEIHRHGIIDLVVEYSDNIKIVDYKLSNIEDENYIMQLNGYKKYIETKTDKPVSIYLYSINKKELNKLD